MATQPYSSRPTTPGPPRAGNVHREKRAGTISRMETAELIKSLVREGRLLAAAASEAGPGAAVPTCPG
jgi:hypothetical protein